MIRFNEAFIKIQAHIKDLQFILFSQIQENCEKKSEKRFTFEKHKKPIKFQLKREYTEKNILKCEPTKRY